MSIVYFLIDKSNSKVIDTINQKIKVHSLSFYTKYINFKD